MHYFRFADYPPGKVVEAQIRICAGGPSSWYPYRQAIPDDTTS